MDTIQMWKAILLIPITIFCFFIGRVIFKNHPYFHKFVITNNSFIMFGISFCVLTVTFIYSIYALADGWWKLLGFLEGFVCGGLWESYLIKGAGGIKK